MRPTTKRNGDNCTSADERGALEYAAAGRSPNEVFAVI
jgi:hypothetical protein